MNYEYEFFLPNKRGGGERSVKPYLALHHQRECALSCLIRCSGCGRLQLPVTRGKVKVSLKLHVYDDHSGRRLRECFHWVLTATPGETLSVSMSVLPKSATLTIFTLFARRRTKHTEAIGASRGVSAVKHRRDVMLFLSSSKHHRPKRLAASHPH
jgi:hypothetical protein